LLAFVSWHDLTSFSFSSSFCIRLVERRVFSTHGCFSEVRRDRHIFPSPASFLPFWICTERFDFFFLDDLRKPFLLFPFWSERLLLSSSFHVRRKETSLFFDRCRRDPPFSFLALSPSQLCCLSDRTFFLAGRDPFSD